MKQYQTIVADPPWPMKMMGSYLVKRHVMAAKLAYPTMTIDAIKAMPVSDLAAPGCHLWLWTVNQLLEEGFQVMREWGFKYHAPITWKKPSGNGNYFIHRTQTLLFGYKDTLKFNKARYIPADYAWGLEEPVPVEPVAHWQEWPFPQVHSRKPAASYQLIESVSDEPRLELFARPIGSLFPKIDGWDVFGNEVESDVELIESPRTPMTIQPMPGMKRAPLSYLGGIEFEEPPNT